jgi:hypothetical protein
VSRSYVLRDTQKPLNATNKYPYILSCMVASKLADEFSGTLSNRHDVNVNWNFGGQGLIRGSHRLK